MLRIVVADDSVLFREGLVRLLSEAGHEVVAAVGNALALMGEVTAHAPDLAIVDVRMPPDLTDDGVRAARDLRNRHPDLAILLLSQHIDTRHATALVGSGAFGYLLKDRVLRVEEFLDVVERVAAGGSALDPAVVAALVAPRRGRDGLNALAGLTGREHEVLELVAQGLTNRAVAVRLDRSERTIEAHMRTILQKLDIPDTGDDHRRVRAVVAFLRR